MRRVTIILGAVLAGQLLLAAVLHFGNTRPAAVAEASDRPLATFERDAVDAVRIEGGDGKTLRVERGGDGWRLPGSDGFPARSEAVERLLRALEGFENRLPVARSSSAHERFHVASDSYERRVTLLGDGTALATVYFGSSAGTGRVYARAEGRDMVYEVGFPLWHAAVDASKWHDTSLAQVEPSSVAQVRMPGFRVRRADGGQGWKLVTDGQQEPASADAGATAKLVRRLAQPGFQGVAKAAPPDGDPALAYTITTREGEEFRYRYFAGGKDGKPTLYRSGQSWAYAVESKQLARLQEATPDTLLAGDGGGDAGSSGTAQASGETGGSS